MSDYNSYKYLHEEYVVKGRSTSSIAKEWSEVNAKVYPNTIRRCLKKHRIPIRDKSTAQKNYLADNPHPMEGRERTEKERRKISMGIQKWWDGLDPTEVERLKRDLAVRAGEKWERMSDTEKKKSIRKMHLASREKASHGSKNENRVADLLKESGYLIIQRTNEFSPRNMFEIDIAIPHKSVAVEWDGIAHFEPIFGEKNLKRNMDKDKRKNYALVKHGWAVIRCRDYSTSHSLAFCQRATKKIVELINTGPKPGVYYIDAR